MLKEYERAFSYIQKVVDVILVCLCWLFAYVIRFKLFDNAEVGLDLLFLSITPVICFLTYWNFLKEGLYYSQRYNSSYSELFKVIKANVYTIVTFVILLYFFAENRLSRMTIVLYFGVSTFAFVISKILIRNYLKRMREKGKNLRFVTLVGNNPNILTYIDVVRNHKNSGIKIGNWLDSDGLNEESDISALGTISDLYVVSYKSEDKHKEGIFLKNHYNSVTPIKIIPDLSYSLVGHVIEDFEGVPLLSYNEPSFSLFEMLLKSIIDKVVVSIGIFLISPVLITIALAVKLTSRGPVLYGQERITENGRKFNMWKFRSMRPARKNEDLNTWESKGNPRITKIGTFLRKTSIDELPQLFNILLGDMSLVGPRPERTHFVNKFKNEIPNYMLRHKMKAGLTGWAQVNGLRGDTSIEERIKFDIFYIRNWSIWLDIKIIILTFIKGFINDNAY
ncbi:MAG: hypothetical protein BM556_08860 [Bacteriovorax sp. MedPE-SWde]|nr:MAG: hypothetical protein BM556_08860 [Bacteriovorax sp. MedPE-SWde]